MNAAAGGGALYLDDFLQVVQSGDSDAQRVQQDGADRAHVEGDPADLHVRADDHTGR